jgi:putative transposase
MRYPTAMPQSLSNVLVHLVFSTKQRHPFLADSTLRVATQRYLATVSAELRCPVITVGGVADHVHLLARQARTITLAGWVRELKRTSSLWLKERPDCPEGFQWQAGYGAFSVSQSQGAAVRRYITRQEAHHCCVSFQDELRTLLDRHQIAYDEHYLWD